MGSARRAKGVRKTAFILAEGTQYIDNETAGLLHPDGLAMTKASCHCEKQRDEAIHKKVAFTLAEVLITLAIIGVVAAITIPGLVAKITVAPMGIKLALDQMVLILVQGVNMPLMIIVATMITVATTPGQQPRKNVKT